MSSIPSIPVSLRDVSLSLPETFSSTECSGSSKSPKAVEFTIERESGKVVIVNPTLGVLQKLQKEIERTQNLGELSELLLPIKTSCEFRGVISDHNYKRIWNLFEKIELFPKPTSPHESRCFRDIKLDLEWSTLPELKLGCLNIIKDEEESLGSKVWEDDSVLVKDLVDGKIIRAFPANPAFNEQQIALRQEIKKLVEATRVFSELRSILLNIFDRSETDLRGVLPQDKLRDIYYRFHLNVSVDHPVFSSNPRFLRRLATEFPAGSASFQTLKNRCAQLFA